MIFDGRTVYTGEFDSERRPHGEGVYETKNVYFKGRFDRGKPIEGELRKDGETFIGTLTADG